MFPYKNQFRKHVFRYPQKRLTQFVQEHSVPFIDILGIFLNSKIDYKSIFQLDGLFNKKGYDLTSKAIYQKLVSLDMIDRKKIKRQ